MIPTHISLGKFKIFGVRDGFFHLDGGSMFGVVPKVLWEKAYPADNNNRIKLGLNSLLVDTGQERVLIETGIGPDLKQKLAEYYSVERNPGLVGSLQNLGYQVDDISLVINTHLHFDHCGGNTHKNEAGEFVPTFPKARYVIQKCEWENALHPSAREKPSYHSSYFLPLKEHGLLWLVTGDTTIIPGMEVVQAHGHTACHQCVKIHSEGETLFFLGDMVPTSAHVGLSYIMSYDLFPLETLKNKEHYFEQSIHEDWILAFNHDPEHFFGRVQTKAGKYVFTALSPSELE